MKTLHILLIALLGMPFSVKAEWQRQVINYTRHEYKAGNQNWMIGQHTNGWMYVANSNGLLEFDGNRWNLYPMQDAKARAMKIGKDGRIYIGGIGQFGYFTPNKLGGLDYTSLSKNQTSGSTVGVIWNILQDKDRIYFQSDRSLFCWANDSLDRLEAPGEIYTSAILYNRFYVTSAGGIFLVENKTFRQLPGSGILGRIAALLPYNGQVLIVTRYNGLFVYDGLQIRKLDCVADSFMRRSRIFCAALSGSLLALGSVQEGVCLLDMEKNRMSVISIGSGLQNKTVLSVAFDMQNNLWLGLDNGIDCVQLSLPVFALYGNKPVIGSGYSSCVYGSKLYLGTNQGIFVTKLPDVLNEEIPMDFIPGTGGQVWAFLPYDGKLFCASDNGIFVIDGSSVEHLGGLIGVRNIIALNNHPDALIASTYGKYSGLYLLQKKEGRWQVDCRLKDITVAAKCLMAERSGSGLWLTNKSRGISRLELSADLREVVKQKEYNHDAFLHGTDVYLAQINNEIVFASRHGLWYYNSLTDSLEEHRELEGVLDGKSPYTYLSMDAFHNIWYVSGGALRLLRYDAQKNTYSRNPHDTFLRGSLIEDAEHVEVNGEYAVVGTEEGFSLVLLSPVNTNRESHALQIRRVYLTERKDSLVYGRSYQYEDHPLIIPYQNNSLRIEYSASNYGAIHPVFFSYRLSKGNQEGEWSAFSENNVKEFTDLHEGSYVFSVRLLPEMEEEPVTTSFAFEVLPPWYRTWWCYLICIFLIGLMFCYAYHRVLQARRHLLMQKELELYKQRQSFQQECVLKDEKIDRLKEENLQAELRHKSEELIHTTLNIVRKNEMLMEIKKDVLSISHAISEENLVALRRKTLRLLGQIDTNIQHDDDLQAFQNTFDSVHHGFFRKLEENYPELSNKDKLLCAYLKMDLLSKEIAPLMNISLRGVEISRYRLRKKLGLDEGESLSKFLQQFGE